MAGPLTRAQVEVMVVARCRGPMALAGMAVAGTPDADLNEPLATALDELGLPPGDRALVVDADFAPIAPGFQGRLIDLVEIRTLETALQFLVGRPKSIQWEDYRKDQGNPFRDIGDLIDLKWKRYNARWVQNGTLVVAPMQPSVTFPPNTAYYPGFPFPPFGQSYGPGFGP